jgi:acetyltransferase
VDLDQLQDVLVRVGRLIADHPRIAELDINPFVAHADATRGGAVDVRIRLGSPDSELSDAVKSR